jgi:hypothetical protein
MNLYQNGRRFQCVVPLKPPGTRRVPYTKVDLQIPGASLAVPVIGKIDTGAFKTMLSFDVARTLGLSDPRRRYLVKDLATSASGHQIQYYVHQVIVSVESEAGMEVKFIIYPGFVDNLHGNLFGIDWVDHFCLALDGTQTHLLRD